MITLITGTPGAGKTLYSLRFLREILGTHRFVYAHGITGLTLPHEVIICESQSCDFCRSLKNPELYKRVRDWRQYAEEGSVFFIDESQNIYRSKGSVSVADFEVHRHDGLDFFIITQHPMLINSDLRKLVGRHIHLVADFLGRWQYEWSECSQNLSKTSAIKSRYNLDKSLFALYQSATLHTKVQRKIPFAVWLLLISVVVVVVFAYPLFVKYFGSKQSAHPQQSIVKPVSSSAKIETTPPVSVQGVAVQTAQVSVFSDSDIELLPESPRWRLVNYRHWVDSGSSYQLENDLKSDSYTIEDANRNQRRINSRRCRVIDSEIFCVVGGKLVASWTGQQQQQQSVFAVDSPSKQLVDLVK